MDSVASQLSEVKPEQTVDQKRTPKIQSVETKKVPVKTIRHDLNPDFEDALLNAKKGPYSYEYNTVLVVIDNDPTEYIDHIEVLNVYYYDKDVDLENNTVTMTADKTIYPKKVYIGKISNQDLWKFPANIECFTSQFVEATTRISNYDRTEVRTKHCRIGITSTYLPYTVQLSDYKYFHIHNHYYTYILISKCEIGLCYEHIWTCQSRYETIYKDVPVDNTTGTGGSKPDPNDIIVQAILNKYNTRRKKCSIGLTKEEILHMIELIKEYMDEHPNFVCTDPVQFCEMRSIIALDMKVSPIKLIVPINTYFKISYSSECKPSTS